MVRSCDLLPCAWQGDHVFPGPGEKLGDLHFWEDFRVVLLVSLCGPYHRRCPGHMESPLKTLSVMCLPNKCQHRAHAQLLSSFESLFLAHV